MNEKKLAISYLSLFSKLIRNILQGSVDRHISLEKELEILKYYIEMEKLRFENKFDYTITVDEDVDTEYTEIPSLILQPFVENAIIHGLQNKETRGTLTIEVTEKGAAVLCIIKDDGIGREAAMKLKEIRQLQHKSIGLSLTKDRLDIVNQMDDVSVKFIDLKNKKSEAVGTRVEILIKQ